MVRILKYAGSEKKKRMLQIQNINLASFKAKIKRSMSIKIDLNYETLQIIRESSLISKKNIRWDVKIDLNFKERKNLYKLNYEIWNEL